MMRISNQRRPHKLNQVGNIVPLLQLIQTRPIQHILRRAGDLHIEIGPIFPMKQVLSRQHLVEQTAQRPHVGGTGGADAFPAVVVVGLLLEVQGQGEHFGRLDALGAA